MTDVDDALAERGRVELIATRLGYYVQDVATDDYYTTFYVIKNCISGRMMMPNALFSSWSSETNKNIIAALSIATNPEYRMAMVKS